MSETLQGQRHSRQFRAARLIGYQRGALFPFNFAQMYSG